MNFLNKISTTTKVVAVGATALAVAGAALRTGRKNDSEAEAGGTKSYRVAKRVFDVASSTVGIVGTSPLWVAGAVGTKIQDPGPVFYTAHRVGKGNKEFKMLKFRSMRVARDADESSLRADEDRIFPWGKVMRDSKIDELPQLLNVLNGTMSVIGPRPASVDQVAITRAGRNEIVGEVPCGLSGPSALYDYIVGDAITDEDEYAEKVLPTRLALDVYYVQNMNATYDLKMIVYTIVSVFDMMRGHVPEKILDELIESACEVGLENGEEPYRGESNRPQPERIAWVQAVLDDQAAGVLA